jgi:putative endonuclease
LKKGLGRKGAQGLRKRLSRMGPALKKERLHQKIRRKFTRVGRFSVYILECSDGSFYTGYTNDLKARLKLHNSGRGSKYVRSRRPVKLAFFKKYRYYKHAVREEQRIKTLTRRQKERLIRDGRVS